MNSRKRHKFQWQCSIQRTNVDVAVRAMPKTSTFLRKRHVPCKEPPQPERKLPNGFGWKLETHLARWTWRHRVRHPRIDAFVPLLIDIFVQDLDPRLPAKLDRSSRRQDGSLFSISGFGPPGATKPRHATTFSTSVLDTSSRVGSESTEQTRYIRLERVDKPRDERTDGKCHR